MLGIGLCSGVWCVVANVFDACVCARARVRARTYCRAADLAAPSHPRTSHPFWELFENSFVGTERFLGMTSNQQERVQDDFKKQGLVPEEVLNFIQKGFSSKQQGMLYK